MRVLTRQPILAGVATKLQTIGATGLTMMAIVQILKDPEIINVSHKCRILFRIHTKVEDGTDSVDHLTSGAVIVIASDSNKGRQPCH